MMMAHWSWLSGNISSIPKWDLHIFEFSLGHVTLSKQLMYLRNSLWDSYGVIYIQSFLSFSIGEDWISYEISENLHDHGMLFWYFKIQGTYENRVIFWTSVRLIIADNVEPKFGKQSIVIDKNSTNI